MLGYCDSNVIHSEISAAIYVLREYASVSSYFDNRDVLILNWINWYSIGLKWLYEENTNSEGYMKMIGTWII